MKAIRCLILMVCMLCLAGCGDSDECLVRCEIEGLGDHGIELLYNDRGVKRISFHPVGGKVDMRINLPRPALLEAFTLDGRQLFCLIGQNGEEISVKMNLDDPTTLVVEGNEPSATYARIVALNDSLLSEGTEAEVNALVTREVHAAPASMASTLLLINHFNTPGHELQADSLLHTILPEARPGWLSGGYAAMLGSQLEAMVKNEVPTLSIRTGSDTTVRLNPSLQSYSLIFFSDKRKPDTIVERLRSLRKDMQRRRLGMLEVSVARDSTEWKNAIERDSARWQQAWVPGGTGYQQVRNLAVPRVPFYIVADSTGKYVYRGHSLYEADTLLRSRTGVKPQDTKEPADSIAGDTTSIGATPKAAAPTPMKLKKVNSPRK